MLALGTFKEALEGMWVDGIVPGSRLQHIGRGEIHFLPIATPQGVGEQSPTNFQKIDFIGSQDKSGWREGQASM